MFCSRCGKRVLDSMLYCPFCGAKIIIPEQDEGAQPSPPEGPEVKERFTIEDAGDSVFRWEDKPAEAEAGEGPQPEESKAEAETVPEMPPEPTEAPEPVLSEPEPEPASVEPMPEPVISKPEPRPAPIPEPAVWTAPEPAPKPAPEPAAKPEPRPKPIFRPDTRGTRRQGGMSERERDIFLYDDDDDIEDVDAFDAFEESQSRPTRPAAPTRRVLPDPDDEFDDDDDDDDEEGEGFFSRHLRGIIGIILFLALLAGLAIYALSEPGQRTLARVNITLPLKAEVYGKLGFESYNAGNYAEAGRLYERALAREPGSYSYASSAAMAYVALGEKEKAAAMLKKCVELNPDAVEPYIYLLNLYPNPNGRPWEITQMIEQGYLRTGDMRLKTL